MTDHLSDLPNVGKVLETHLNTIGIHTPKQLADMGSREAFLRIRSICDPGACLSMLCGLEGAIQGVRGWMLSNDKKADLKIFFDQVNGRKT